MNNSSNDNNEIEDLKRMLARHSEIVERARNDFIIKAEILRAHYNAMINVGFSVNEAIFMTNEFAIRGHSE